MLVIGLLVLGAVLVVRCTKARRMNRQADGEHVPVLRPQAHAYAQAQPPQQQQPKVPLQQQQPQAPLQQPLQKRPLVAPKPQYLYAQKAQPPNQPHNQYEQRVKAGPGSSQPLSLKDASFADRSGPSGASGSAVKDQLGIPSREYSEGTVAFDGMQSGPSGVQHDYSEGTVGVAWMQSGSGPSGPSGAGASGSANYPEPRAPLHDYSIPEFGTVGGNTYDNGEGVGAATGQQDEGEASYDPTYDKLHAYHPRHNPESATVNDNA